MSWKNRIILITPIVSLMIFIVLKLKFELPYSWASFILIPLMPIILGKKKISVTLVCVVLYIIVGIVTTEWHIWWIILLFIPVYHILFSTKINVKRVFKNDDFDMDDFD